MSHVVAESLEGRVLFARASLAGIAGAPADVDATSTLTRIEPAVGTIGGDTLIGLTGTGFLPASVAEADGVALATNYQEPTEMVATIPAADLTAVGTLTITVATPGSPDTAPKTFTVTGEPMVESVSPSSVAFGSPETTVTLTGGDFMPESAVYFASDPPVGTLAGSGITVSATFVNSTTLTVIIPATQLTTAGQSYISVVNPSGPQEEQFASGTEFTVDSSVTLAAVAPSSAVISSSNAVITITGTNFVPTSVAYITVPQFEPPEGGSNTYTGTGGVTVSDDSDGTLTTTFVNSTELTAVIPASDLTWAGTLTIQVDSGTLGNTAAVPFLVMLPPTLAVITPASATVGSPDVAVTLSGSGFLSTSTIEDDGTPLTTEFVSDTELTAVIPAASLAQTGTLTIEVDSGSLGDSNDIHFTVTPPPPVLSGISPATAPAGTEGVTVTLTGTNFLPTSVADDNGVALPTTFLSDTELTAIIPPADLGAEGTEAITIATPNGSVAGELTAPQTFTVGPPPPGLWAVVAAGTVPAKIATGAKVKGVSAVTLTNTAAAADDGVNMVELYAVPSGSTDMTAGTLLATVKRKTNLAAGASQTLAVPIKALKLTAGTYALLARTTDAAGRVLTATIGPSVTVAPPAVSLAAALGPVSLTDGAPVTFAVTVTNYGNTDSTGVLAINIGVSPSGSEAAPTTVATSNRPVRVRAGTGVVVRLKGRVPAGMAAGLYNAVVNVSQVPASAQASASVEVVAA